MTDLTRQQVTDMLAASEAKVDARLANFDTTVKTGFAELRAEFAGLRTEIANSQKEASKQSHESMKWIVASIFTMLSISVAIIGVMINFSKADKTPAQPVAAQAPTIIAVPPGSTLLSAPQAPAATTPPAAKQSN